MSLHAGDGFKTEARGLGNRQIRSNTQEALVIHEKEGLLAKDAFPYSCSSRA